MKWWFYRAFARRRLLLFVLRLTCSNRAYSLLLTWNYWFIVRLHTGGRFGPNLFCLEMMDLHVHLYTGGQFGRNYFIIKWLIYTCIGTQAADLGLIIYSGINDFHVHLHTGGWFGPNYLWNDGFNVRSHAGGPYRLHSRVQIGLKHYY